MPRRCNDLEDELRTLLKFDTDLDLKDCNAEEITHKPIRKPKVIVEESRTRTNNKDAQCSESSSEDEMNIASELLPPRPKKKTELRKQDPSNRTIRTLCTQNQKSQTSGKHQRTGLNPDTVKILQPNLFNLDAEKELWRMLSSKSRNQQLRRSVSYSEKRNPFYGLKFKDRAFSTRESIVGGLALVAEGKEGQIIQLQYSNQHNIIRREAEILAATGNIAVLQQILARFPCHLDVLYYTFSFLNFAGESTEARELLDHTLFCLGEIHASFRFSWCDNHAVRMLPYAIESNQIIFEVLSAYVHALLRQECTITAFEVLRMLWNLDRTDPMHTIFNIEFCGLKNKPFTLLLDFLCAMPAEYAHLPNVMYTKALCTYSQECALKKSHKESSSMLSDALTLFPSFARCMYTSECEEILPQAVRTSTEHAFVEKVCSVSAARNSEFWRTDCVKRWVRQVGASITQSDAERIKLSRDAKLELLSSDVFEYYKNISLDNILGKQTSTPIEVITADD